MLSYLYEFKKVSWLFIYVIQVAHYDYTLQVVLFSFVSALNLLSWFNCHLPILLSLKLWKLKQQTSSWAHTLGYSIYKERIQNLIFFLIQLHSSCMSKKYVVAYNLGFGCRVTGGTVSDVVRTSTRWKRTSIVSTNCKYIWFVDGDPMLDPISKCFKHKIGIFSKIFAVLANPL